jgi:hypothetical protein
MHCPIPDLFPDNLHNAKIIMVPANVKKQFLVA